ncbi:acyltransferase [Paraflavitalea sp. CAU 1676]|uniref:acyltransferase family protein n=1 Tax=Paraflavitalea sp. CAU 1676 TaxID=3032598 RepID=UPI0023D9F454|nr:acyltransferase [Paraflavitalea sp. CAU 1676]MDF2187071.1 acyltransferase [Paraflavitalea sp. CAU 1676]
MNLGLKKLNAQKEIASIDLLRGIASCMVCFFHLAKGNEQFLPEGNTMRQIGSIGWTGVQVFFVISGFVIPYAMYIKQYTAASMGTFLKKRIIRIEPPYLISIVLVVCLNFVSTLSPYYRGAPFSIDWGNLLGHVAYLNIFTGDTWLNPVYWTLAIEFQYYLLIAFAYSLIVHERPLVRYLFFIAFVSLSFFPWPSGRFLFTYAPFFLSGILFFQFICGIIKAREFFVLFGATCILLGYQQTPWFSFLVLVTVAAINYVDRVPKVFRFLGLISYSLYLIHVPIGGRIINLCEARIQNVHIREAIVIISFLVCIGASYLFYRVVEVYFKKLSSSFGYRRKNNVAPVVTEA